MTSLIDLFDIAMKAMDRWFASRTAKQKLKMEQHIEPAYRAIEELHTAYVAEFLRYRSEIRSSELPMDEKHPILETIHLENLISDQKRRSLLELGRELGPSNTDSMYRAMASYLVNLRIANDPASGYSSTAFKNPQRWRTTLLNHLRSIFGEHWQTVLDPYASAPPLYGAALEAEIADRCRVAGIAESDPRRIDLLKRHIATEVLESVMGEMQEAFQAVTAEYARLRRELIR